MTPREVVQRATEALNAGRIDEALDFHSDSVEVFSPSSDGPGWKHLVGKDALRKSIDNDAAGSRAVRFEHQHYVCQDDWVAAEALNVGTIDGRQVRQPVALFFRVLEGKIVSIRTYYDHAGFKAK